MRAAAQQQRTMPLRVIMVAMAEDLGALDAGFTIGTVVLQSGAQRRLRVHNGVEVVRGAIAITRDTCCEGVGEQVGCS